MTTLIEDFLSLQDQSFLVKFFSQRQLNKKALELYNNVIKELEVVSKPRSAEECITSKTDNNTSSPKKIVLEGNIILDKITKIVEAELSQIDLWNGETYNKLERAIFNWDAKELGDDEYKIGQLQGIFLDHLPMIRKKQEPQGLPKQQEQIRSVLEAFNAGLLQGKEMLEKKVEALSSQNNNANKDKIELLQSAIGIEEVPAWAIKNAVNFATFTGLSSYIQGTINSNEIIADTTIKKIYDNFNNLVQDNVLRPMEKYQNERGFLSKLKEWACDLSKKLWSKTSLLSTKGTLKTIISTEHSLFKAGRKKTDRILGNTIQYNPERLRH